MSYKICSQPKNFSEYIECYNNEITVRRLFPRKEFNLTDGSYRKEYPTDNNRIRVSSYSPIRIACGYETRETDKPGCSYNPEKNFVYNKICATEDYLLFHGDKVNYIDGLDKLATEVSSSIQSAIEKYKPARIIGDRHTLWNIKTDLPCDECQFIPTGTVYLFPEITPDIAEFVIWKDVYEDPVPFRQKGGSNFYNIYEWVTIALHDPKKFIKVV
jgi:hypothetical protein